MNATKLKILVAGAGPGGLLTALQLAKRGIPLDIVERDPERSMASKAITIDPFAQGLLTEAGVQLSGARTVSFDLFLDGVPAGRAAFDGTLGSLHLPQHQTEEAIETALGSHDIEVRRPVMVERAAVRKDGVRVKFGDGTEQDYDYVIDCTGVRGVLRGEVDPEYHVEPSGLYMQLCDAPLSWERAADRGYYDVLDDRLVITLPIAGGQSRVVVVMLDTGQAREVWDRQRFTQALERAVRAPVELGEPTWLSSARPRVGVASRFWNNRIVLCADSAKVLRPLGGKGMVSGFADAVEVADALAGVIAGEDSDVALGRYSARRRAYALEMEAWTARLAHHLTEHFKQPGATAREKRTRLLRFAAEFDQSISAVLTGMACPVGFAAKLDNRACPSRLTDPS